MSMLEVLISFTLMGFTGMTFFLTLQQATDDVRLTKEDAEATWLTINTHEWLHSDRTADTNTATQIPYMDTDLNSVPFETNFPDLIKDSGTLQGFRVYYVRYGYTRYCCGALDMAAYGMCMENTYVRLQFNSSGTTWETGGYWWLAECDTSTNTRSM